ncbi:hypothetical protein [Streptomyces sp. NPDC005303]|uniref:hypothetical protein n=1 Tax=Streptomyces sp. NPDC005303 TaxID=3155713 RepID=UPI0033A0BD4D
MTDHDDHVQHTWRLAHPDGEEITIDLWTDNDTVRVDGGDHEDAEGGQAMVDRLLATYTAAGWRRVRDYAVNDAVAHAEPVQDDAPEPHGRPEKCPDCGAPVVYEPRYGSDVGEGAAWLCTGCKWGQWLTA